MKMKTTDVLKRALAAFVTASLVGSGVSIPAIAAEKEPYLNDSLTAEERALDLVSRMTPAEKYAQLNAQTAPAIKRLGVREYDWWSEGLHGVARDGVATSFPTGLGIAASWDPDLVKQVTSAISDEAREKFNAHGNAHGLNYWSPTINMARDPRWGRAEETYGEDPYLTAQIGGAFIKGFQGDTDTYKAIATAKHFLGNNSEQNRHNGSSNIDERDLHEYYTRAFKDVVEDYNVGAVMTSYNAVNGVPMSVNKPIVTDLLRETWGFDGFVVTDCGALDDIVWRHQWRPENWGNKAWGGKETSAYAIKAGVDLNCGAVLRENTANAVKAELLSDDEVDRALVRLFTARMKTGEFDENGGEYGGDKFKGEIVSEEHKELAEKSSDNGVVLLKNESDILPIKNKSNIVLVGGLAEELQLGDYSTWEPHNTSTVKEGIEAALKRADNNAELTFIKDTNLGLHQYMMNTKGPKLFDASGKIISQIDWNNNSELSHCRVEDGGNIGYAEPNCWVKFKGGDINFTNVNKITVEMAGTSWDANPAKLEIRANDPENGQLLGTVTSTSTNGWTDYQEFEFKDLSLGGGYNNDDIYFVFKPLIEKKEFTEEDKAKIREADTVIYFAGTRSGENGYHEESDGANLDLPNDQAKNIEEVAALNANTVVYMQAVSQINIEPFKDKVKGILWSTYNGQAQGNAAGRILFGEVNPSGKLPFTWYTDVEELAHLTDYTIRSTDDGGSGNGRGYQYFKGNVTYPFGYGMSYTDFEYSNIAIDKTEVTPNDTITVTFDVKNTGSVKGSEAAQVYVVSPNAAANNRPAKRLEGFDKQEIEAGEIAHYTIEIPVEDLWYWDADSNKQTYDQGTYTIQVGADSQNTPLTATFTLSGQLTPTLNTVTVIPSGHIMEIDGTLTSELTASKNDQSFVDFAADGATVTYKSSNPAIAEVDNNGKVTAKQEGTATITASVTLNGKALTDSFPVKVQEKAAPTEPPTDDSGKAPQSFDFTAKNADEMKQVWTIQNEDNSNWTLNSNGLTINTQSGDLSGGATNYKNLFVQDASGDWIVETEVTFEHTPDKGYQQAGLIAMQDEDNYVKMGYEGSDYAGTYIQLTTEDNGNPSYAGQNWFNIDRIYFRIEKSGNKYTCSYSTDKNNWSTAGTVENNWNNVKVGLLAINGETAAPSLAVTFKNFSAEVTRQPGPPPTPTPTPTPSPVPTQTPADERPVYETYGNPYLPMWDHNPDVEPYVFEDPDNPGKYRLYVYGSHDILKYDFCGTDLVTWSAPVDDLSQWRYDGVIFQNFHNGQPDVLFAPDIQERIEDGRKVYYLYPNDNKIDTGMYCRSMVCKGYRPDGPFEVINWADDTHNSTEGPLGFDPAVLINDDGEVYAYWGSQWDGSYWAKLDKTNMYKPVSDSDIHRNLPVRGDTHSKNYWDENDVLHVEINPNFNPNEFNIVQDENMYKWGFFEASSIRKVGNKYVFVYSRNGIADEQYGAHYGQLAYGYSDSPEGPWKWGGILVDSFGEAIPKNDGSGNYDRTFSSSNTHGSIIEVNGQWYVFYHRADNMYARQAMVEGIDVEWDEKPVSEGGEVRIKQAEMTSKGFSINGLNPYRKYDAGITSYKINVGLPVVYDSYADFPVTGLKKDSIVGIKHFDLNQEAPKGKTTTLEVELLPKSGVGNIDVYMRPKSALNTPVERDDDGNIISVGEGSVKIGTINFTEDTPLARMKVRIPASQVDELNDEWGLFFAGVSESSAEMCDLYSVEFVADDTPLNEVVMKPLEAVYKRLGDVQYLTDQYTVSSTMSKQDQTNADLDGIPQIALHSTGRIVCKNEKLPKTEALRISYEAGWTADSPHMNIKLYAASDERGSDAVELAAFDFGDTGYQPRLSDMVDIDKSKVVGKEYLILEVVDLSSNCFIDYIELLSPEESEEDPNIKLPDTVKIKATDGGIAVTSAYDENSNCDMYIAAYDLNGVLVGLGKNEAECTVNVSKKGTLKVKVFFWEKDGMKPVFDPVEKKVSL